MYKWLFPMSSEGLNQCSVCGFADHLYDLNLFRNLAVWDQSSLLGFYVLHSIARVILGQALSIVTCSTGTHTEVTGCV